VTRTVEPPPNCRCVPCDFGCDKGKWHFDWMTHDCYGCNGSGISERCEEHKEKNDDE